MLIIPAKYRSRARLPYPLSIWTNVLVQKIATIRFAMPVASICNSAESSLYRKTLKYITLATSTQKPQAIVSSSCVRCINFFFQHHNLKPFSAGFSTSGNSVNAVNSDRRSRCRSTLSAQAMERSSQKDSASTFMLEIGQLTSAFAKENWLNLAPF